MEYGCTGGTPSPLQSDQLSPIGADSSPATSLSLSVNNLLLYGIPVPQRPYRKDRLPRAYFCCRQLAKFRIVQGICLYNMLVCYKPAGQSFPDFGVWVSVDLDSKYKIVCGETRDHRIPILEEIKKS